KVAGALDVRKLATWLGLAGHDLGVAVIHVSCSLVAARSDAVEATATETIDVNVDMAARRQGFGGRGRAGHDQAAGRQRQAGSGQQLRRLYDGTQRVAENRCRGTGLNDIAITTQHRAGVAEHGEISG